MLKRALLMIGIVVTHLAGCVSDDRFIDEDTVVTIHKPHDGEATLDGSLQAMMRTQSSAQRCLLDDEGHPVCCEIESAAECCVHSGPSGDLRVCL
jgi:hypothetical protein